MSNLLAGNTVPQSYFAANGGGNGNGQSVDFGGALNINEYLSLLGTANVSNNKYQGPGAAVKEVGLSVDPGYGFNVNASVQPGANMKDSYFKGAMNIPIGGQQSNMSSQEARLRMLQRG